MLATYNPKDVIVTFGPIILTGFADGSFVSVERAEDTFSLKMGADGTAVRVKNPNRSGTIKVTLSQTSPANDLLSAAHATDDLTGLAVLPMSVKDGNGTTIAGALRTWVKKPPGVSFAKDASDREWTFETDRLEMFVGGSTYGVY